MSNSFRARHSATRNTIPLNFSGSTNHLCYEKAPRRDSSWDCQGCAGHLFDTTATTGIVATTSRVWTTILILSWCECQNKFIRAPRIDILISDPKRMLQKIQMMKFHRAKGLRVRICKWRTQSPQTLVCIADWRQHPISNLQPNIYFQLKRGSKGLEQSGSLGVDFLQLYQGIEAKSSIKQQARISSGSKSETSSPGGIIL